MDAETFALPGVACDDGEISACNGENGAAILGVGIELSLLWLCGKGAVGHDEGLSGLVGDDVGGGSGGSGWEIGRTCELLSKRDI